jgi:hypothetical protein
MILVIGNEDWPFPIPVMKKGDGWVFDIARGSVLRARAQAELDLPTKLDTEEPRTLASQFIQPIFAGDDGARCSILSGTSKDKVRRVRKDNNPTDQRQRMTI